MRGTVCQETERDERAGTRYNRESSFREQGGRRGNEPESLFYLERTTLLHHSSSPRIMAERDDSERKHRADEREA
ncbi:hypothetical protein PBY51_001356 [Eleginops maclovinus]|uniref:Uncharacterized protein n=1 Tax=Eleginops maclovinus TaxID=56733 RepID=A0AAN7WXD2_ELEMC|nr:hypothetical protein PBY51_001356 [Eleginops maclovinus]